MIKLARPEQLLIHMHAEPLHQTLLNHMTCPSESRLWRLLLYKVVCCMIECEPVS